MESGCCINLVALPECIKAEDVPTNQIIDSALNGAAFFALRSAIERCNNSVFAVFEALYDNGTKVDGRRAWCVESCFDRDLYVVAGQESFCNGEFRIPLSIGFRCEGGCIHAVRDWLTICIRLE